MTNVGLSACGSFSFLSDTPEASASALAVGVTPSALRPTSRASKVSLVSMAVSQRQTSEKGKNLWTSEWSRSKKNFTGVPGDSWGVLGDFPGFSRVVFFIIFDRPKAGKVHVKVKTPRQRPSACNFQASGSFKPPQAAPTIEDTYSCETHKFGNRNHRSTKMYIIESKETYLQGISQRNGG